MGKLGGSLFVGLLACIGCGSSGGGGGAGGITVNSDGGIKPGEKCTAAATCGASGANKSYQQCTAGAGTAACTSRYLASDGKSFSCVSCTDCQAAASQVGAWCGGAGGDGGVPPDDSTCPNKATSDECLSCCKQAHPTGDAYFNQIGVECLCNSPGLCKRPCKTELCVDQPITSGDTCDTCISDELDPTFGSCSTLQDQCDANADCAAETNCITNCP